MEPFRERKQLLHIGLSQTKYKQMMLITTKDFHYGAWVKLLKIMILENIMLYHDREDSIGKPMELKTTTYRSKRTPLKVLMQANRAAVNQFMLLAARILKHNTLKPTIFNSYPKHKFVELKKDVADDEWYL